MIFRALTKNSNGDDTPNVGKYKRILPEIPSCPRSIFRNQCMIGWKNEITHYENQFCERNYIFWWAHEEDAECAEDLPY